MFKEPRVETQLGKESITVKYNRLRLKRFQSQRLQSEYILNTLYGIPTIVSVIHVILAVNFDV